MKMHRHAYNTEINIILKILRHPKGVGESCLTWSEILRSFQLDSLFRSVYSIDARTTTSLEGWTEINNRNALS